MIVLLNKEVVFILVRCLGFIKYLEGSVYRNYIFMYAIKVIEILLVCNIK